MIRLLNRMTRTQKAAVFMAIDMALIPLALLFTYAVQPLAASPLETLRQAAPILPALMIIAAGLSIWLKLPYIQLNAFEHHAVGRSTVLVLALTGSAAGLTALAKIPLPPGTHVIFGASYFLSFLAVRVLLYQIVLGIYRRARPRRPVLIYGAGSTGLQLAQALKTHERIVPAAFVDDNVSLQGMTLMGLPVYPPARLAEVARARGIRRVLLAMPSQSQPKQAQIVTRLQQMGFEVQALPSFAQLIGEEPLVDKLTLIPPQNFLGRAARDVELAQASASYAGRSVLVSGAGGSIGAELCRQILSCGPTRLVLYELSELALYTAHQEITQLTEGTGIEVVPVLGSVTDPRLVRKVLTENRVQVVLHAAAYKHVPLVEANPLAGLANNVFGTQTLAREAAETGVERFILISSDKAVRPANVMGASKRMAELVVQDLAVRHPGTVFATVRFGNVLGSSGSVVPLFQDQISRGGPVTVTDARVKRYFMTIREAVQLVLCAGAEATGDEIFVLDMGEPVAILHLARQVIQSAGYSVRDADNPQGDIAIEFIGLRPGEKLQEELSLNPDLRRTRYQKIFCAQEDKLSEIEVAGMLRGLRQAMAASDAELARDLLERWIDWVPTPAEDLTGKL